MESKELEILIDFYLGSLDYESAIFHAQNYHDSSNSTESLSLLAKCFILDKKYFQAYSLLKHNLDKICPTSKLNSAFRDENKHNISFNSSEILSDSFSKETEISDNSDSFKTKIASFLASPSPSKIKPKTGKNSAVFCDSFDLKDLVEKGNVENLSWEEIRKDQKLLIYYYGVCCLKLDKFTEGLTFYNVLSNFLVKDKNGFSFGAREYRILGEFHLGNCDNKGAALAYEKSNELDSLCWSTVERLCKLHKKPLIEEKRVSHPKEINYELEKAKLRREKMIEMKLQSEKENSAFIRHNFSPKKFKNCYEVNFSLNSKEEIKNEPLREITNIVSKMIESLYYIKTYEAKKAFVCLKELPKILVWPVKNLGVVFNEIGRFELSEEKFSEAFKMAPYNLSSLDIFSSTLWQLKKEAELCFFQEKLSQASNECPSYFVLAANSLNLDKKHKLGIEHLKLAKKMDKSYGYCYCIMGHERIALDDFSGAERNFRQCLKYEPFEFKAWNGLAMVAVARSDYQLASQYFKKALALNGCNHVLLTHLAITEYKLNRKTSALEFLDRIKGENILANYHKAKILFELGNFDKSEKIVKNLLKKNKNSAMLLTLLGRIQKGRKEHMKAMSTFTNAACLNCDSFGGILDQEIEELSHLTAQDLL